MPRYNFIMWLAVMGKLHTRDRLRFLQTDPSCVFCRDEEESHNHLFFACHWTSLLWLMTKSWLRINKRMSTINIAIWGLHYTGNNTVGRMRRVSLGILIYLIWEERNKRIFYNTCNSVSFVFSKLQVMFFMVLHFHEKNHFNPNLGVAFLLWHYKI
jgi:hypothetical protein